LVTFSILNLSDLVVEVNFDDSSVLFVVNVVVVFSGEDSVSVRQPLVALVCDLVQWTLVDKVETLFESLLFACCCFLSGFICLHFLDEVFSVHLLMLLVLFELFESYRTVILRRFLRPSRFGIFLSCTRILFFTLVEILVRVDSELSAAAATEAAAFFSNSVFSMNMLSHFGTASVRCIAKQTLLLLVSISIAFAEVVISLSACSIDCVSDEGDDDVGSNSINL
jgi:hypothetical protein